MRIKEEHRVLLKAISDGIRSGKTMEELMLELGYSESYAKSSTHLKETDSWNALLEETLSDDELLKVHKELLHNKNWKARDNALDKGYKLKKRYDNTIKLKHQFSELSDEDIERETAGILAEAIEIATRKEKKD